MKKSKGKQKVGTTTVIDIYPEYPKPDWVQVGALCHVAGEGWVDVFKIDQVLSNRVLLSKGGRAHGAEAFHKLYPIEPEEIKSEAFLDEVQYPFSLRFRIDDDGTFVFPVQSEIENVAMYSGQDTDDVYMPEGITLPSLNRQVRLVYSDCRGGWILF